MRKASPKSKSPTEKLVNCIIDGIQDVKGKNVVKLDMRELKQSVADFFIICSGESSTQVEGIYNSVVRKTRKDLKEKPWHTEGAINAQWILLDYIDVVVHVFYRDRREFYNLEDLWADSIRTDVPDVS